MLGTGPGPGLSAKTAGHHRHSGPDRPVDGHSHSAAALDVGIALSIATATLILVMASLVERPTDFQAFPVLLLVSLLIRLS